MIKNRKLLLAVFCCCSLSLALTACNNSNGNKSEQLISETANTTKTVETQDSKKAETTSKETSSSEAALNEESSKEAQSKENEELASREAASREAEEKAENERASREAEEAAEKEKIAKEAEEAAERERIAKEEEENNKATTTENRTLAEQAFALTNETRVANGLPALSWNESFYQAALVRANEILIDFSHTRPNCDDCSDAFDWASAFGENIAAGQDSSASVMDSWMNSKGHRDNILGSDYTNGAVACIYVPDSPYGYYWVGAFNG